MRLTIAVTLFAFGLMAPVYAEQKTAFEGPQKEIDAILAVFTEWAKARDAGDVEGVVAIYHPEMRIMTRDQAEYVGHKGVREFYSQYYAVKSERKLYASMSELRVFGDAAFVTGKFLAVDLSKRVEDPGYYLIVVRKDKSGAWRLYRDIDTPSPDGLSLKPGNLKPGN